MTENNPAPDPNLVRFCEKFSPEKERAILLATQLEKRARQLAEDRSISEIEAMQYLLSLMTSGISGGDSPHSASSEGFSKDDN